jgi:8-oxo-dGTP diphosphatase
MIKVTCAIIEHENKTLVVQRSEFMKLPLKWEFPGGKLENDETEEECLKREIKEELNIEIILVSKLTPVNFQYPTFEINLIPFIAKYLNGNLQLTEHKKHSWLTKNELNNLDWAEADIAILKEYLEYD